MKLIHSIIAYGTFVPSFVGSVVRSFVDCMHDHSFRIRYITTLFEWVFKRNALHIQRKGIFLWPIWIKYKTLNSLKWISLTLIFFSVPFFSPRLIYVCSSQIVTFSSVKVNGNAVIIVKKIHKHSGMEKEWLKKISVFLLFLWLCISLCVWECECAINFVRWHASLLFVWFHLRVSSLLFFIHWCHRL